MNRPVMIPVMGKSFRDSSASLVRYKDETPAGGTPAEVFLGCYFLRIPI